VGPQGAELDPPQAEEGGRDNLGFGVAGSLSGPGGEYFGGDVDEPVGGVAPVHPQRGVLDEQP
jgi:hypothetical protein